MVVVFFCQTILTTFAMTQCHRADKHNWDLCHDYSLNPYKPAQILTKKFALFSIFIFTFQRANTRE